MTNESNTAATRPYLHRGVDFGEARYYWPYYVLRRTIPRQLQYTMVWIGLFTLTCVGWWFLFHDVFSADQVARFMKVGECYQAALAILVGFLLVLDWQSGTDRYQRGGIAYHDIMDNALKFASGLRGIVTANTSSKRMPSATTLSMLTLMQDVTRASVYASLVLFRDFSLHDQQQRRVNIQRVLNACMSSKTLNYRIPAEVQTFSMYNAPTIEQRILDPDRDVEFSVDKLVGVLDTAIPVLLDEGIIQPVNTVVLSEPLTQIRASVKQVTTSILIVRPTGASHFITSATFIFLFFLPLVLYTDELWFMLMLNATIVFVATGLLFIGRQMREPYEDSVTNPYSDLNLPERADKYARVIDEDFDVSRAIIASRIRSTGGSLGH